jgi:exopolyphosphatase/guanosine-5'-triphosphate,3'-diphosphate pyrophosphatase
MSFTPQDERRLRKAACMLVGVGKGLDPNYRADLVFEDVLYAPLAGLTHKERAYLALIIFRSFTGRSKTPNDAAVNLLLDEAERRAAEVYGLAIRLAVVGSGRSTSLLKKLTLTVKDGVPHVRAEPGYEALLGPRLELRLLRLASVLEAGAQ